MMIVISKVQTSADARLGFVTLNTLLPCGHGAVSFLLHLTITAGQCTLVQLLHAHYTCTCNSYMIVYPDQGEACSTVSLPYVKETVCNRQVYHA